MYCIVGYTCMFPTVLFVISPLSLLLSPGRKDTNDSSNNCLECKVFTSWRIFSEWIVKYKKDMFYVLIFLSGVSWKKKQGYFTFERWVNSVWSFLKISQKRWIRRKKHGIKYINFFSTRLNLEVAKERMIFVSLHLATKRVKSRGSTHSCMYGWQ